MVQLFWHHVTYIELHVKLCLKYLGKYNIKDTIGAHWRIHEVMKWFWRHFHCMTRAELINGIDSLCYSAVWETNICNACALHWKTSIHQSHHNHINSTIYYRIRQNGIKWYRFIHARIWRHNSLIIVTPKAITQCEMQYTWFLKK